jgi:8-oxo-dGTP pyrophosphatase MutT (NUDIX family)
VLDELVATQPVEIHALARQNIRAQRARLGLTQASVAHRMNQLGFTWYPQTVGLVERNKRPLDIAEVYAVALCMETTPAALGLPGLDIQQVVFGGVVVPAQRLSFVDDSVTWDGDTIRVTPTTVQYRPLDQRLAAIQAQDPLLATRVAEYAEHVRHTASDLPVVAAIVTSSQGVLVGRRVDGNPPWTFIAGEQEPGERPVDTIIREVKEETGLEVRPGEVIGERDHPATGRHMIYMAAKPARGTKVIVGDEAELAEVRWVSLAEADELMAGMIYEPVREYLAVELRRQAGGGHEGEDQGKGA